MTKFLIVTEKKHNRSNKKQRCHIFLIDFVAASFFLKISIEVVKLAEQLRKIYVDVVSLVACMTSARTALSCNEEQNVNLRESVHSSEFTTLYFSVQLATEHTNGNNNFNKNEIVLLSSSVMLASSSSLLSLL